MISVTGVTNNYILQPALMEKHKKTLEWLSLSIYWKSELAFFQKILDDHHGKLTTIEDRQRALDYQNFIFYYNDEVIEELRRKLRNHENKLAKMLETKSEWETQYYKEHDTIMSEAEDISSRISEFKKEFLAWA